MRTQGAGLEEHLGAELICRSIQRSQRSVLHLTQDQDLDLVSATKVYLSFTGLDLVLLGLRLRRLRFIGGGKDHPLTELCEVRGHSGYYIIILITDWLVLVHSGDQT